MTLAQVMILADRQSQKRKSPKGNLSDLLALKARTKRRAS